MRKKLLSLRGVGTALVAVLALLCLYACAAGDDASRQSEARQPRALSFSVSTDGYGLTRSASATQGLTRSASLGLTRGTPGEDLYESMGLYAHTYDGTGLWDRGAGTAPDFMVNEEVQNAGDHWLTVNSFDQMPEHRRVRFYAYYPYGLPDSLFTITDETHQNAPLFTYRVPFDVADQKDVLVGSSFDASGHIREYQTDTQNGDTPEAVELTLSHVLTAVRLQVGKCSEAGRIRRVEFTSILGTNTYSMHRDGDDTKFVGWTAKSKDNNTDDYRNVVLTLDLPVSTTQYDGTDVKPQPVTDDTQWFMMLPQTLSEDSWLLVTYYCGGDEHLMQVPLENLKWLPGKKVTYTLNIESLTRLTLNSTVEPWGEGLYFQDGQPTNATSLELGHEVTDWDATGREKDVYSDDIPEGDWQ